MFCRFCGSQVEDGLVFCSVCGRKLDEKSSAGTAFDGAKNVETPTQQPYVNPSQPFMYNEKEKSSLCLASFISSMLGIFMYIVEIIFIINERYFNYDSIILCFIAAFIIGITGMAVHNKNRYSLKWMGIVGLILGSIGIILCIITLLLI